MVDKYKPVFNDSVIIRFKDIYPNLRNPNIYSSNQLRLLANDTRVMAWSGRSVCFVVPAMMTKGD